MKRASRTASRIVIPGLLVILGACLLSANVSAEIHYFTQADFPLTLTSSVSGDTVRFGSPSTWDADSGTVVITGTGTLITIPSGGGPSGGCYIQAENTTFIYGTDCGNSYSAFRDNSTSDNGLILEGGYWIHGDATMRANNGIKGSDTTSHCTTLRFTRGSSQGSISFAGYDSVGLLVKDVRLATVTGLDAEVLHNTDGKMVEISGGHYRHEGMGFEDRQLFTADVIDNHLNTVPNLTGSEYHFKAHGITVENAIHRGIVTEGPYGSSKHIKGFIYDCTVHIDARNDLYKYPGEVGKPNATVVGGGGYFGNGTTNASGLGVGDAGPGSKVYNNVIITDSTHYGCDIMITCGNAHGSVEEPVEIFGNECYGHRGLDSHYGYMTCKFIKSRYGHANLWVHDNFARIEVDSDSTELGGSNIRGRSGVGIRWLGSTSSGGDNQHADTNVVIEGNHLEIVDVGNSSSPVEAFGYIFEGSWVIEGFDNWNGNFMGYNHFVVTTAYGSLGKYDPCRGDYVLVGDTIEVGGNHTNYYDNFEYYGGDCDNIFVRDAYFVDQTAEAMDESWPAQNDDVTWQATLEVTVKDTLGTPVPDATVEVTNAFGQKVVTAQTDENGLATGIVTYYYRGQGSGYTDSTNFKPFTILAHLGSDSTLLESVQIGNEGFDGDTRHVVIELSDSGIQTDVTPPAAPSLSSRPGDAEGSVWLVWTAPGDDGNSGQATNYQLRYLKSPISEGNWALGSLVSGVPSPGPSGTQDSMLVNSLDPGEFYYLAMRAYDDVSNASPLGTTNSFAAGVATPAALASPFESDAEAGLAVLYADPVDSYLSLRYDFQVDDNTGFSSPQTETGATSGAYIAASFSGLPSGEILYWRCRAAAQDNSFTSDWSTTTRSFTLEEGSLNSAPSVPVTNDPTDGSTVTSTRPILTVNNSSDPENDPLTYDFQVYTEGGGTMIVSELDVIEGVSTTSWEVPAGFLLNDSSYSWRARSFDGTDHSTWSALDNFTIDELSASHSPATVDSKAYPSPVNFHAGDVLTFELPSTPVDLTILSPSGSVIRYVENVSENWVWNGTNQSGNPVSSGVYLWYLSDGTRKKVVVVQ